ncbi:MAG: domain containing protein [Solirubrobacterales bacterium]|jgi:hypothetical protein|nr:domain containing protein [Solirubrobacterales bacterium]
MSEEPTRVLPASSSRRPWIALALATACGFLLGALVVTTLGGATGATRTETQRITVPAATVTNGGTVITRTVVPPIVGEPLDVAKGRVERARFRLTVDSGGGLFGVRRDENWEVVAQRPGPGELLEQGSTVHVDIVRR